ncbi:uncharacterized protein N7459_004714 [Penicillium hispanicum]|uniref:uncharacterized protein n=1 Tax=Penicillium hispanicum TaxID=1080232 RepID=UPI0025413B7C|nr:uncharacterized protein N7459_004714 [Penicillium hispanicum]KAJ5584914.1 hypothetical protein N7459_004714 [Penicillium hispanicum]
MKLNIHQRSRDLLRILLSPALWFDVYWPASRKYWFSLLFIGVICAKVLHIYSHLNSLTWDQFLLWGPTFFLQDVACVVVAQLLCQKFHRRWARVLAAPVMVFASVTISGLAAANISFYSQTGAEIHWRQAHSFHRDPASVKTLLTGLTGIVIGEVLFSAAAWLSTPYIYNWMRGIGQIVKSAIALLFPCWKRKANPKSYEQVPYQDWDEQSSESESTLGLHDPAKRPSSHKSQPSLLRILVALAAVAVLLLRCVRPSNTAYSFLSQTVIVSPFEKPPRTKYSTVDVPDMEGDYSWLANRTALSTPPKFDWLPEHPLKGFRDWYGGGNNSEPLHYDPAKDPIHISNLDLDVIEPLREALRGGNVSIKHIFLLKLESTRADMFPLRKESHAADIIRESYSNNQIPDDVETRLANLTRNAERLTGVPSGFDQFKNDFQPYGGIYASNAYTGDTFTLKSILASVCGIAPLVVDFNQEYHHHIYEPCMPHILTALNEMHNTPKAESDDYRTWPWRSTFMQSITDHYDNQDLLLPALGYDDKITDKRITKDTKHQEEESRPKKYNFWGYPEHELRGYFLKALQEAEEKHERLFLTHLTGQTHHPWVMPKGDKYEEMIHTNMFSAHKSKINRYLNTLGVADRWIGEIFEILEEAGVADETLVVTVGDHGISLFEDSGVTPYDNPHVSSFHVPLVFSHPQLPPIKIDGRVTSMQILPTILDLLVESASMPKEATRAITDLLPLYEGQSMIRELVPEKDGKLDWQFTVMNTGATWLALRSAPKPYRLIIPLVPDVEWRFSNVDLDPHELHTLQSFNLLPLLKQVGTVHGDEAVEWIKEAAHVAQWWVAENWRRYEYVPE